MVIVAVAPTRVNVDKVKAKAQSLIGADRPGALDLDVDLWAVGPSKKTVFLCFSPGRMRVAGSRQHHIIADCSVVRADSNNETATFRCIERGHWDVGLNLYSNRSLRRKVDPGAGRNHRSKSANHHPFASDVALHHAVQTVNVLGFELGADGKITLREPPLEPITDAYKDVKP